MSSFCVQMCDSTDYCAHHTWRFVCFAIRFNLMSDQTQNRFSENISFTASALVYIGNVYRPITVAASKPFYSVTRRNLRFSSSTITRLPKTSDRTR